MSGKLKTAITVDGETQPHFGGRAFARLVCGGIVPKLHCPCGFVHDQSPIPDAGWITVRDRDYEELIHAECHHEQTDGGHIAFARLAGLMYDCQECGRLMWRKPGEQDYRVYRREVVA